MFEKLFRNRKLDRVPQDHTHYEKMRTYNIYWKIDVEDVYLWNGVGHYWQQMFYVDIEKYQEKLISAKTEEIWNAIQWSGKQREWVQSVLM